MSAEVENVSIAIAGIKLINGQTTSPYLPTATRPITSILFSRGNLVSGRLGGDKSLLARPSTSIRAVGYAANRGESPYKWFDEFFVEKNKQRTLSSANAAALVKEVSPQVKHKHLEAKILKLLEESIIKASNGLVCKSSLITIHAKETTKLDSKSVIAEALNKAKEAFSLDRTLHRFRDQHGENVFHNFDMTYAVFFNLAEQYERNDMHIEALNTYSIMTKNKMFVHVNQLKLNMGNIYYRMGMYSKAIKMFRMALDSVPNNLKQLRLKITHNIGILFVRMGQYADAAASFEYIMSEKADIRSGIHLMLCYYAMGDVDKIRTTFRNFCNAELTESEKDHDNENNLLKLQHHVDQEQQTAKYSLYQGNHPHLSVVEKNTLEVKSEAKQFSSEKAGVKPANRHNHIIKLLKCDDLAMFLKQRRNSKKRAITTIVDLISPIIEENYNNGYNWCTEVINTSNLSWLTSELELNKALVYLRQSDVSQAINTLQMYDRKTEGVMTASALTNLSFIYINLGSFELATRCIQRLKEMRVLQSNSMVMVNASIIDIYKENYATARVKLEKALQIQPNSFEAKYNLGLVAKQTNDFQLGVEQFQMLKVKLMKAYSVQHSHVYYQFAKLQQNIYSTNIGTENIKLNSTSTALQAYLQVMGISASEIDSHLLEKVGFFYDQMNDHHEANQYYKEALRINPSDIRIASSVGSYFIELDAIKKSLYYYERAVLAIPTDPNLMMRIASCFRNTYLQPKQYLRMLEQVRALFPENLSCLRALKQITKSVGLSEVSNNYSSEYARLVNTQAAREIDNRQRQQRLPMAAIDRAESNWFNILWNEVDIEIPNSPTANLNRGHFVRSLNSIYIFQHRDPLGPRAERPRTGTFKHGLSQELDDEMYSENLLPR